MDLIGLLFGWVNTALLGVFGLSVLLTRRWRHLRWLPVYFLVVFSLAVVYKLWLYNSDFYFLKLMVSELLSLGVAVEILRKEAGKRPLWPWLALLCLVILPFAPIHPFMRYFLPFEVFALGLALEIPTALRIRSAPLLAWSLLGAATLVSDLIKYFRPWEEVYRILVFLDPWWFMGFSLILLAGLFWPELERSWRWLLRLRPQPRPRLVRAAEPVSAEGGNITSFPRNDSAPERSMVRPEPATLEVISDKLDAISAAFEASSMLPRDFNKPFLSPRDLAVYLGTDEETARKFVERKSIDKVQLTDDPEEWVVFRADVDSALGDE